MLIRKMIVIFFLIFISLIAQTHKKDSLNLSREIGIKGGLHLISQKDILFSPLVYQGNSLTNISLYYLNKDISSSFKVQLTFSNSDIELDNPIKYKKNDFTIEGFPSTSYLANVEVGYNWRIFSKEKLIIYLGSIAKAQMQIVDYDNGIDESKGFGASASLGFWLSGNYNFDWQNSIEVDLYGSLISWTRRPHYSTLENVILQSSSPFEDFIGTGELNFFTEHLSTNASITYSIKLSPNFKIGASFFAEFIMFKEPLKSSTLVNNFNLIAAYLL